MKIALFLLALLSFNAFADSKCPELYPYGKELQPKTYKELCNSFFVTLYDTSKNRVILSAEKIIPGGDTVTRTNDFHSDDRLGMKSPKSSQYTGTGYDRGHMAPAADASSNLEMYDTFLMSNMTPQDPTLNRNAWRLLEEKIRSSIKHQKDAAYILTVADYTKTTKRMNGIPVPNGYYKITIINNTEQWYYAENKPTASITKVSKKSFTTIY